MGEESRRGKQAVNAGGAMLSVPVVREHEPSVSGCKLSCSQQFVGHTHYRGEGRLIQCRTSRVEVVGRATHCRPPDHVCWETGGSPTRFTDLPLPAVHF